MQELIWFFLFSKLFACSQSIYDPGVISKPIYTSGIKTTGYNEQKPIILHHNYSRVNHQSYKTFDTSAVVPERNSENRPFPVYNAHAYGARPSSQDGSQTFVLNEARIRNNQNPTRQIVLYNKNKRSPQPQAYKICPRNATGQFVYELSCNQFLNCWKGRRFVQNCAPGTLFNPKSLVCDFPEKVQCITGPRQNNLQKSAKFVVQVGCPINFSGLIPNYTDCSKLISCVGGIENIMQCPPGTLFDANKNICDFDYKAACFNEENKHLVEEKTRKCGIDKSMCRPKKSVKSLRLLSNHVECSPGATGLYKHPTDCSKFLNCDNGRTYIQDCAPGTLFNPQNKICDFPYNVHCEVEQQGTFSSAGQTKCDGSQSGCTDISASPGLSTTNCQDTYQNNCNFGSSQQEGNFPTVNTFSSGCNSFNGNCQFGPNQIKTNIQENSFSNSNTFGSRCPSQDPNCNNGSNQQGETKYENVDQNSNTQHNGYPNEHSYVTRHNNQHQVNNGWSSSTQVKGQTVYNSDNQYGTAIGDTHTKPFGDHNQNNQGSHVFNQPVSYDGFNYNANKQNSNSFNPPNFHDGSNNHREVYTGSGNVKPADNYDVNKQIGFPQYNRGTHYLGPNNGHSDQTQTQSFVGGNSNGYPNPETNYNPNSNNNRNTGNNNNFYNQKPNSFIENSQGINNNNRFNTDQTSYTAQEQKPSDENIQNTCFYYTSMGYTKGPCNTFRPDLIHNLNQGRSNVFNQSSWNEQRETTTHNFVSNRENVNEPTPNYNHVVNIDQHKATTQRIPENSNGYFSRPTSTAHPQSNDYEDTYGNSHSSRFIRSTTSRTVVGNWPPSFPSTDVNADYVYEYDDDREVTLEAENFNLNDNRCSKNTFSCSTTQCIPQQKVCNGVKDCPSGKDELHCIEYLSKFTLAKAKKLAILEKEKWNNVSIATCASLCLDSKKLLCRSFNYRKMDKTCSLSDANEALTGALIAYSPFDYYELISEKIDCSQMVLCNNKKCISKTQICDGQDDCGDRMDEKECKEEDFGYSIRLVGPKKHEGYIEVTAFGKTGYVCDDNFGLRDADVVCRELGFSKGALQVRGNSFYTKNSTLSRPFYLMDDVTCIGNETRLMDCDFSGWGVHNCLGEEVVGVECKTSQEHCRQDYWQCDTGQECLPLDFVCDGLDDCSDRSDEAHHYCDAPTEIRLVNGSGRNEGRVEIKHFGTWGTICDDDFNEDAAKVVCKQLGYTGSSTVKKNGYFGSGKGPIWLDQVFCSGNESNIESCTHWNWGEHNCEHSEDVGIICSNTLQLERHSILPMQPPKDYTYPRTCGLRKDNFFNVDGVHARVVRGSVAKPGDYPWQAAIRVKGKSKAAHWCGAIILSDKFVLTAAHCLVGYAKGAYVIVAGDYNVDEDEGTEQQAYIEDFYLHENFREGHKMNNDIALVKLKGHGLYLNDNVQAICLPDANTSYEGNQNCTISGFGSIESGKSAYSHNLRAGWVPLQKREVCKMPHVYGDALSDGMFCAGSLDEGVDTCDGDSGGPLACLKDGVFTLYGITSWGQHCGFANKPGVYVKVAHYRGWIDKNFQKHSATS